MDTLLFDICAEDPNVTIDTVQKDPSEDKGIDKAIDKDVDKIPDDD